MIIINKDGTSITNMEHVTTMFTTGGGNKVSVNYDDGKSALLGAYNSPKEAEMVLQMIARTVRIGRDTVFYMPTDEEVRAKLALDQEHWHHATGKKTKGHGGS